ncbi:MAG TPA: PD-(D/E)XK nuclease family protein, partial [Pseudohongiella sp.]|nr:PD-(D/E)XK nuclease family protein [Pseudohongiella sp.]
LAGGNVIENGLLAEKLQALADGCRDIVYELAPAVPEQTITVSNQPTGAFKPALMSSRAPAEPWWIASYSALKTGAITMAVQQASDDQVAEEALGNQPKEISTTVFSRFNPGMHGFHRGASAGTFLHSLLEWACKTGFALAASNGEARLQQIRSACEIRGWQDDVERLDHWLGGFISTTFTLDASTCINLSELETCQPEMEFLFATRPLVATAIDTLCQQYLMPGAPRPELQPARLNGMIKGFIDLVFEHEGRYYVADWKSNYLGPRDEHYTTDAMQQEVLKNRYEVQYAIYLLALHRLLRSRLPDYDYNTHVGGAVYFFLRGWQSHSQGIVFDRPPVEFIEALDQLFVHGSSDRRSA